MNSPLTNTTVITFCGQDKQIDAKIIGQMFEEKVVCTFSK